MGFWISKVNLSSVRWHTLKTIVVIGCTLYIIGDGLLYRYMVALETVINDKSERNQLNCLIKSDYLLKIWC